MPILPVAEAPIYIPQPSLAVADVPQRDVTGNAKPDIRAASVVHEGSPPGIYDRRYVFVLFCFSPESATAICPQN